MLNKIFRKCDKTCRECGKVVCICGLVGGLVVAPVIEAIKSPPEVSFTGGVVQAINSPPPEVGVVWAPHGEDPDYTTSQPAIEPAAETGGAATTAAPLPPWGWEEANRLPPAYRYPPRRAASNQFDDGISWMVPLVLRSTSTST
jgi:hypothetical protein